MTKRNFLFSFLIIAGLSAYAQTGSSVSQIPANVQNKFHTLYPNATNVTWEQAQSYFIPVFMNNNVATKLLIDLKGTLVHTSVKILPSALPAATTSYISGNYSGQTVTDAEKLTMINNSTRYEAVVGGHDLLFDAAGKFIKVATGPLKQ